MIPRHTTPRRVSPKREAALRATHGGRLPASTIAGPKKSIKKKNAKRRVCEFARSYHSKARVRFVQSLPCPVCLALGMRPTFASDNAHIVGGGAGRKADYDTIVPLCRLHHRALHAAGSLSAFYVTFGCKVDLAAWAAQTQQRWLLECGRQAHLARERGE